MKLKIKLLERKKCHNLRCNKSFTPKRRSQIFCCHNCKDRFHAYSNFQRRREKRIKELAKLGLTLKIGGSGNRFIQLEKDMDKRANEIWERKRDPNYYSEHGKSYRQYDGGTFGLYSYRNGERFVDVNTANS
jgi:hypothetical protein